MTTSGANPFEAVMAFWARQGETLMQAQTQAYEQVQIQMAEAMKAMLSGVVPGMAGLAGSTPAAQAEIAAASADMARANQSMLALWSAATDMGANLTGWLSREVPADSSAKVPAESGPVQGFPAMADPRLWLAGTGDLHATLNRMSEGPRFADLWDAERRYLRLVKAWMDTRRCSAQHNAVMLQAWMQAARHFNDRMAVSTEAEPGPPDAKAALALWTETANAALVAAQRSDEFLHSQTAMVRAATELNLAQQDLVEFFGKQYGFPTRTELDDVHRSVTELKRELRAVKRQLDTRRAMESA